MISFIFDESAEEMVGIGSVPDSPDGESPAARSFSESRYDAVVLRFERYKDIFEYDWRSWYAAAVLPMRKQHTSITPRTGTRIFMEWRWLRVRINISIPLAQGKQPRKCSITRTRYIITCLIYWTRTGGAMREKRRIRTTFS
jgi:hypothetical protein